MGTVVRLPAIATMGAACSSCLAYLGRDDDPARAHSEYIVNQVIFEHGYKGSDVISRTIEEKFQGFYYGGAGAAGKLGDVSVEVEQTIVDY